MFHNIFLTFLLFAYGATSSSVPLESWIKNQEAISTHRLLQNISPVGTYAGIIIASPSRDNPNYYFHWTRDASLVMYNVIHLFKQSQGDQKLSYQKIIKDFVSLSRMQQLEPSAEGLGEPRYTVDGKADTIKWSRPQYDGPALRALALIKFLKLNDASDELKTLSQEVIRTDLDYVIKTWNNPCFDIWEELKGKHFYTQYVQHSALLEGGEFFKQNDDLEYSNLLNKAALEVSLELKKYWDSERGYIGASRDLELGSNPKYKNSNLDTAVVLAILHGSEKLGFFKVSSDQVRATVSAIEKMFLTEYRINKFNDVPAIGRFSDDVYYGGNPWYLTTAAFAEFYYKLALTTKNSNRDEYLVLSKKGDSYLSLIQKYIGSQGEMSEQFDRDAGVPASAKDLTWSYASFLSAINAREVVSLYK